VAPGDQSHALGFLLNPARSRVLCSNGYFRFEKSTLFLEGSAGRRVDSWWQETPAFRAYWDVELSAGGLYRIFRDEPGGEWFADGVYD
jgi:hypothetical protein